MSELDWPTDYTTWDRSSPFLDHIGPLAVHTSDPGRFGFRVDDRMVNGRDLLHAGAISTIVDVCVGHTLAAATDPPTRLLTVGLSVQLIGTAVVGDWVSVDVTPIKVGKRLATGQVTLATADRIISTATVQLMSASSSA